MNSCCARVCTGVCVCVFVLLLAEHPHAAPFGFNYETINNLFLFNAFLLLVAEICLLFAFALPLMPAIGTVSVSVCHCDCVYLCLCFVALLSHCCYAVNRMRHESP